MGGHVSRLILPTEAGTAGFPSFLLFPWCNCNNCSLKEHSSNSERLRYHKEKPQAQRGPTESRGRLQQAAQDTCPGLHSSPAYVSTWGATLLLRALNLTPPFHGTRFDFLPRKQQVHAFGIRDPQSVQN